MDGKFFSIAIALIVLSLGQTLQARAQYVEANKIFTAGQKILLTSADSDSLIITYRPGSNISSQRSIKKTDGRFQWTPRKAGIFAITSPEGPSQTVSVQFDTFPLPGFFVLVIAGIIIFGGAVFASVNLFGNS